MADAKHKNQLPIPEGAVDQDQAAEVLRAWIVGGQLHLAAQRSFDKPEAWGMLLMDLARHAARMYAQQGVMPERDAFMRIANTLGRQLGAPGGMDSGQTTIL